MKEGIRVIVAAHKEYRMPSDPMYLPLQVGAAGKGSIGFQRDDAGENISGLNPYFCELTGLYWAWKNLDADYIGLVHYRRHFGSGAHSGDKWDAILKEADIRNDLGTVKAFVPQKRRYWIETLYSHYKHTHYAYQMDGTRKIIGQKYPQYVDAFDSVVKRRWGYMFNMMILEHTLLDAYCSWLFSILFELRDRLGEEGLSSFQSRYYGRISEIIFNVWLEEQVRENRIGKAEIRELPVIYMEKINWRRKGTAFLLAKFSGKKYEKSF